MQYPVTCYRDAILFLLQSEEDIVTSAIRVEFHERNLALFTRRSVKLSVVDEKILKSEIATPSIVSYEVEEDSYFGPASPYELRP